MQTSIYICLVFCILGLLTCATGQEDWPTFRGNLERTGYSEGTADLSTYLVSWGYTLPNGVFGSPVAADLTGDGLLEIVIVLEKETGSNQDSVFVFDSSGKLLWKKWTNGGVISTPAIADVDGDNKLDVIIATTAGELYALDGETGHEKWSIINRVGAYRSSPAIADSNQDNTPEIFIGYNNGTFYSINGESGIVEWSYNCSGEITSSPAIGDIDSDGKLEIVIGTQKGILYTFENNGTLIKKLSVKSPIVFSTPVLSKGRIFIGTTSGELLEIVKGSIKKTFKTGGNISGSAAIVDGPPERIIFGTAIENEVNGLYKKESLNKIWAIDDNANLLWSVDVDGWTVFSSAALADIDRDGVVEALIGNREGKLYVVNSESGEIEWTYSGGTGLYASPALADIDQDGDLEVILGYRFSNQVKVLDSPDKADLKISSVDFSEKFPKNEMDLSINITVENVGEVATENSTITIYRRSPILDFYLTNLTVAALEPGQNTTINFVWEVELPPGKVGLYFEIDKDNKINESDNTNNEYYNGFLNDLSIGDYELLRQNKKAIVNANIINEGRLDYEGIPVIVTTNDSVELDRMTIDLGAGSTNKVKFVIPRYDNVSGNILIFVDPENKVLELDEENNKKLVEEPVLEPVVEENATKSEPTETKENKTEIIIIAVLVLGLVLFKVIRQKKNRGKTKKPKKKKGPEKEENEKNPLTQNNEVVSEKKSNETTTSEVTDKEEVVDSEWASSTMDNNDQDMIKIGSDTASTKGPLDELNEERSTLKMELALIKDDYKNKKINKEVYEATLSNKQKRLDEVEEELNK